jgi:hypothetical protein
VQLLPDTNVDSVRSKLPYDLYYVRHFQSLARFSHILSHGFTPTFDSRPLRRGLLLLPHGDELDREAELPGWGGVEFGMM